MNRPIYPKPEYFLDNSPVVAVQPVEGKRVSWDAEKTRTLLEAIKTINNGQFLELLNLPLEEKKRQMNVLKNGWDLVRRIMLKRYPDFSLTRVQLSDKWRKLHCTKSETTAEVTKKTTEELMKEFHVGEQDETSDDALGVISVGIECKVDADAINLEYTPQDQSHDECSLEGEGSSGSGKRKTTEEVLAELENEAYIKPPMKKKLKKIGGNVVWEGRTPVECKRMELMVREHKARLAHENEIFYYERKIKLKKLEILELVKTKLESQPTVNLDVLSI